MYPDFSRAVIGSPPGLGVFQGKVLFLNTILRLNFTREAKIERSRTSARVDVFKKINSRRKINCKSSRYFTDSLVGIW